MRKILIFCCFILSEIALTAQNPANRVDSSGLKQGLWREYKVYSIFLEEYTVFLAGPYYITNKEEYKVCCDVFECIGEYKDGMKTGTWTEYHFNGNIRSHENYTNGIPAGWYKRYYTEGGLAYECFIEECDSTVLVRNYDCNGNLTGTTKVDKKEMIESVYDVYRSYGSR